MIAVSIRAFQPEEVEKGSMNLRKTSVPSNTEHWRNHHGLPFRVSCLLSWAFDFICFLHLTPMFMVGTGILGIRGQSFGADPIPNLNFDPRSPISDPSSDGSVELRIHLFGGMYIFGLQSVKNDPAKKERRATPTFTSRLLLVARMVLNHLFFFVSPIAMFFFGQTIGGLITGTTIVIRPRPNLTGQW